MANRVTVSGRGLHSGIPTRVALAPADDGITLFHRRTVTPATPEHVTDVRRNTSLGPVSTMEHLLSALSGAGITDAHIICDAKELPVLDGSALAYLELVWHAGRVAVPGTTPTIADDREVVVSDGLARILVRPGTGKWCYTYDLGSPWPAPQRVEVTLPADYAAAVAPARTITREAELPAARAAGFARGLTAETSVMIGAQGYCSPVRFADEPARHKILDLVGDLSLAGIRPETLDVEAVRSGHRLNVRAAAALRAAALTCMTASS